MALTEAIFELLTPYKVGALETDDLTTADFTTLNNKLYIDATNDGLTGDNADWGTAYLIADILESKSDNGAFVSEKIGEYSYKKGDYSADGVSYWMQKYNNLMSSQTVEQPSGVAVRSDSDMSKLNIDQNPIPKYYGV